MVATQLTLAAKAPDLALAALTEGLSVEQAEAVREAHEFARREFAELRLSTGEPVFDHTGNMVAALTSLGAMGDFNVDWDSAAAKAMRETAKALSGRLGYGSMPK